MFININEIKEKHMLYITSNMLHALNMIQRCEDYLDSIT